MADVQPIATADILSALSHALDLVEGQPVGHAVRTCILAMNLGARLELDEETLTDLYFAALLKDAGCSANSVRIHAIFGDDHAAKRAVKLIDWTRKLDCVTYALKHMQRGQPPLQRFAKMVEASGDKECHMDALTAARCSRGADIAIKLGFGEAVADAVRNLDEHWNGMGAPDHLAGDAIPLLSRILCLCQTLDVLVLSFGLKPAFKILRKRTGRWFDPAIAQAALGMERDESLWNSLRNESRQAVLSIVSPATVAHASDATIDDICEAFASIIDAKSSYTSEHSRRVTRYALEVAGDLGFDAARLSTLRRASLLHDIGKLAVPTAILDKKGRLDEREFEVIKSHPRHTEEILGMIRGFGRITEVAAAHHERLDGRGYHRGIGADQLDVDMRIVSVVDVFDALTAARPYREALKLDEVFAIMEKDAGAALDPALVGILKDRYGAAPLPLAA